MGGREGFVVVPKVSREEHKNVLDISEVGVALTAVVGLRFVRPPTVRAGTERRVDGVDRLIRGTAVDPIRLRIGSGSSNCGTSPSGLTSPVQHERRLGMRGCSLRVLCYRDRT